MTEQNFWPPEDDPLAASAAMYLPASAQPSPFSSGPVGYPAESFGQSAQTQGTYGQNPYVQDAYVPDPVGWNSYVPDADQGSVPGPASSDPSAPYVPPAQYEQYNEYQSQNDAAAGPAGYPAPPPALPDPLADSGGFPAAPAPPEAVGLVTVPIRCHLNGEPVEVAGVWIADSLLFTLRERLGRTGSKDGCGEGECGACLVLLDGEPVLGCLTPALAADGAHVTTVEAYGEGDEVSAALAAHCGAGCGYCLPGIGLSVRALLARQPEPSEAAIRESLSGHLCRCLPPGHFIDAVHEAVERRG